jgi:uncharacterized metal-binding protein YceD (DUF177 family)
LGVTFFVHKKAVLAFFPLRGLLIYTMPHKIRAAHIKDTPQTHEIVEDEAARTALAALFGLPKVAYLRGVFVLQHEQSGVIAARLHLRAQVTQECVITLEPFDAKIDEQAALRFVPAAKITEGETEELDAETLDGPDEIPFTGEWLDLSAALAEQLALALDPYPKKPGAALPGDVAGEAENPFAVLAKRKLPPV